MEHSCLRHTLIPGTSKLLLDFLYHFDRVSAFYPLPFCDPISFRKTAEQINFPHARRQALVSALRKQNGDSPALDKLAQPDTVAVVTGQQVGLFSGPIYTIFKALTAVRLAQSLESQGLQAVPVFWLATEDHDLAEVDHAWVFDHSGQPTRLELENTTGSGGPVGAVKLRGVRLAKLRAALGDLPFADEITAEVERTYQPDTTLGAAFGTLLRSVLRDFDLLYLDPLDPAIREIGAPFLAGAVPQVPDLNAALRNRNQELVAAGYHAQVHIEDDTSLLFLLQNGKRLPLRWKNDRFTSAKDRSFNATDLQAMGDQLSPNALLRPVLQDYLLPTVAYVGGPAEIAYMAQAQVLYQELLGRMPVIYPRNGFTLLDSRANRLLEKYALQVPDFLNNEENVRSAISSKLIPADLHANLVASRTSIANSLKNMQSDLLSFDPTLAAAAQRTTAKMLFQADKLEKKAAREALRRDERASSDTGYLMNTIYPHQHLQERFYSVVPFLAKYGREFPQRLMQEVQLACPDHMIRVL